MVTEAYLDNGRTTPMDPRVLEAMLPLLRDGYGVPSGLYARSMRADQLVEDAQAVIAGVIGAKPEEIVFTSSATEANNIAIRGTALANRKRGNHIIISPIEHPSVMDTADALAKEGFEVDRVNVDAEGFVDLEHLRSLIRSETILVSIQWTSHFIGTIQRMKDIGEMVKSIDKAIVFHTNAVGAFGMLPVNVDEARVDLLTANAHKLHGPQGIGALYVRKGTRLKSVLSGVQSKFKLHPGEENVPAIVGFAEAARLASHDMAANAEHVRTLQAHMMQRMKAELPEATLNGPGPEARSPYNLNYSFHSIEGEAITLQLDMYGIAVATGSACASKMLKTSYVIAALGKPPEAAHGSIRFTFSRMNTVEEIDHTVDKLKEVSESLARISAYKPGMEG